MSEEIVIDEDTMSVVIGQRLREGSFVIDYIEKRFVLCNDAKEALLQFTKAEISTKKLKKKLQELLNKDEKFVDKVLAVCISLVAQIKAESENRKEGGIACHYLPSFVHENVLYEECYDDGEVFFLACNLESGEVERVNRLAGRGWMVYPIFNSDVRTHQVLLPSEVLDYGDDKTLTKNVMDFLNYWHDPINVPERQLDVNYAYLTYIKDLIPQVPYRRSLGKFGFGKTVYIVVLGSICYRGILTAGCSTDISLVRSLNAWRGTAIIDEADFVSAAMQSFLLKILNIGFDSRLGWYRRAGEDPQTILSYRVYGPKLLATRKEFPDMALESRCLTCRAKPNERAIPPFQMKQFESEAQELRNQFLQWRFNNFRRIQQKARLLESPNISGIVYGKQLDVSSRIQQIILPLSLSGSPDMLDDLRKLARNTEIRLRGKDPNYLFELRIRDAIKTMVEEKRLFLADLEDEYVRGPLGGIVDKDEKYYTVYLNELSGDMLIKGEFDLKYKPKVGEIESMSKRIKKILVVNLGFGFTVKRRARLVFVPKSWIFKKKKTFFEETLDKIKDIPPISIEEKISRAFDRSRNSRQQRF